MAKAATGGDAAKYRTTSAAIPGAKARVNAALAAVRAGGYQPAAAEQPAPSKKSRPSSTTDRSNEESDVGDSKSDDPSDDEGDSGDSDEP
jgi:hypothetical protein